MFKNKTILCVITARKGSKGLLNKNLLKLDGKSLVAWPIIAASKSKYVDEIYLSTDCKNIMNIGKRNNLIERPLRHKKLSTDNSSSIDVVLSVINILKKKNKIYDYILLLEPTSPFTTYKDIDNAIKKLINNSKSDSLVSIIENTSAHPNYNFTINKEDDFMIPYKKSNYKFLKKQRRQDLAKLYYLDGSLYISKINSLIKNKNFCNSKTIGLIMSKYKSFEIDDYIDLLIARTIKKNLGKIKKNEK